LLLLLLLLLRPLPLPMDSTEKDAVLEEGLLGTLGREE
jgi:hypothetical protein